MTKLPQLLETLNKQLFVKTLREQGEVFLVGGIVRDSFLNIESKDIDLLVTGIEFKKIQQLLTPFGRIDLVGKSFGVLKFVPKDMDLEEPIDIAIPRVEESTGTGHTDFKVTSSHDIPVELDLKRRDFTINAIAVRLDGTIIDPFGGVKDIELKKLKMVDEVAFKDDPLRMLRAIQFASRLDFTIDFTTLSSIKSTCTRIKDITADRLLIELDKIQTKGNVEIGFKLLTETGIFKEIFGFDTDFSNVDFDSVQSRGDFFFTLLRDFDGSPIVEDTKQCFRDFRTKSAAFKVILRGDVDTAKCLDAIQFGFDNASILRKDNRMVAFKMFKMSKETLGSRILPKSLGLALVELKVGLFPLTLKDLAISGDDLLPLGFKGIELGDALEFALTQVFEEKVINEKSALLALVKR